MPNKQPSFAERIRRLHDAAEHLTEIAALVLAEADRMAAAAKRFAERADKRERRARESPPPYQP
jgi:hypothetical protein